MQNTEKMVSKKLSKTINICDKSIKSIDFFIKFDFFLLSGESNEQAQSSIAEFTKRWQDEVDDHTNTKATWSKKYNDFQRDMREAQKKLKDKTKEKQLQLDHTTQKAQCPRHPNL